MPDQESPSPPRPPRPPSPREALIAALKEAFPAAGEAGLRVLLADLDRYGIEPYERERERVQRAILLLAAGDAGRLRDLTDAAKRDYRDVLYWAEYPEEASRSRQARPEGDRATGPGAGETGA